MQGAVGVDKIEFWWGAVFFTVQTLSVCNKVDGEGSGGGLAGVGAARIDANLATQASSSVSLRTAPLSVSGVSAEQKDKDGK